MNINLLVVDDEMQIRMGIEKGIPWKEHGISQVFSAENGMEALTIIREREIHILITDIRMPGMTGLELSKKAKEYRPELSIIILSGFSEFEYAKKAIGLGVMDYLLKPIRIPELQKLIADIVAKLEEEDHRSKKQEKQERKESIEYYLTRGRSEPEILAQYLEEYTGYPRTAGILCSVFDCDTHQYSELTDEQFMIRQSLKEICLKEKGSFLLEQKKQWILFTCLDVNRTSQEAAALMKKAFIQINKELLARGKYSVSAGVGQIGRLQDLEAAVEECRELLDLRLIKGLGMYLDLALSKNPKENSFLIKGEEQLRQAVVSYQYEFAEHYITRQFESMRELEITSYDLVKGVCVNLKQLLFSYVQETGLDVEAVLEKNKEKLLRIPDFLTLEQYQTWICDLYFLIIRGITEHSEKVVNNVIITALAYISTNYSGDITVDSISSYVKKSKNYFSYLFKKELGVSFVEYLNKYRVEEAKKLLDTSIDLNYEIAQKVGFRDEKYFSMVFKKIVGCSPSAYRKNKGI